MTAVLTKIFVIVNEDLRHSRRSARSILLGAALVGFLADEIGLRQRSDIAVGDQSRTGVRAFERFGLVVHVTCAADCSAKRSASSRQSDTSVSSPSASFSSMTRTDAATRLSTSNSRARIDASSR